MIIRRAFYSVLFPAAVVLPAWMLVGSALFGGGGWATLGVLLGSIVLFIVMSAISAIMFARVSVRGARAVSWLDVATQTVLYASVAALGFDTPFAAGILAVLIVAAIAGFWTSAWQLFTEAKKRVQEVFATFEATPNPTTTESTAGRMPVETRNDGEYIVIETGRDPLH